MAHILIPGNCKLGLYLETFLWKIGISPISSKKIDLEVMFFKRIEKFLG